MVATGAEAMEVDPPNGDGKNPDDEEPSLRIPITTGSGMDPAFIEIFPEELSGVAASKLVEVMKSEKAQVGTWADAG
eukprot:CAMPEP_0172465720 /NCGR_PEP_ID=MMETSP1065-20121228/54372_1 /TAXON_ID=265537 /ORGANISM="Amphiprora paludosa, Strain CCMP125" /LENGTH=76 /DNA_ID=CAMNT_0013222339 /DNA_START=74 /DNA_END=300 /DNA_ORIENTATION=-